MFRRGMFGTTCMSKPYNTRMNYCTNLFQPYLHLGLKHEFYFRFNLNIPDEKRRPNHLSNSENDE